MAEEDGEGGGVGVDRRDSREQKKEGGGGERGGGRGEVVEQEVCRDSELSPQTVPGSDARLAGTLTPPSALPNTD